MKLRHRFALVTFGVLVFAVITPALILYARGYIYDFAHGQIIKTGAIVVKTEPTKALVYLNNKLQKGDTSLNIRFLAPGDYDIRVEKTGYYSWTKRLSVWRQLVTWVNADREFITLFYQQPKLERTIATAAAWPSSSGNEIVYAKDSGLGLAVVDQNYETSLSVPDLPVKFNFPPQLSWQNAGEIAQLAENLFITDPKLFKQLLTAQKIETDGKQAVVWLNSNLYSLNNQVLDLLDKNVEAFTLDGNNAWYIQGSQIKHLNLANGKIEVVNFNLPPSQSAKIIRTNNQLYVILDKTLYLAQDVLEPIYTPVSNAIWYGDSSRLLYNNDNEISIYDPQTKKSELVLRSQTVISQPVLNAVTGYAYFQNESKIKAIELDGRDHRNVYTLADAGKSFVLDKNGKNLFIIGDGGIKVYEIR